MAMRKTLGAFVDKRTVSTPGEFYGATWEKLEAGPAIVRPRRCGYFEPLRLVKEVDLKRLLSADYLFSNGRRASGSVNQPVFSGSRYYSITVRLETRASEAELAEEVYEWLRGEFRFSLVYMGSPTQELFRRCRQVHQMFNCGLGEVHLDEALRHKELFDRLDLAA